MDGSSVEIIIGTYEEFLLGYKIGPNKRTGLIGLVPTFSIRSHNSSVRCLAIGGKYLATGGGDDKIFIYDMKARKEINLLLHHSDAINALTFTPDCSHLLSGGSDGKMYVTRVGSWMVGADWKKAHGGAAVTNIACHSSSKLAMSLGSDLTLRTWNLVTGRCAFVTNLKTKKNLQNRPDCLQYSPESKYFTMSGNRVVEIWDIFQAKIIKEVTFDTRPTSICWLTEYKLVVGLDSGKLALISIKDSEIKYFGSCTTRIKSIAYVNNNLATVSSDGEIIVWSVNPKLNELKKIASHNIGCRAICIALLNLNQFDESYKLNTVSDLLSDEEIEVDQEKPALRPKQNKIGSVTVEYDNQIDTDVSSYSSEGFEPSKQGTKNKRKNKNRIKNSSVRKQKDDKVKINKTTKETKSNTKDDSFNSSEEEPIIKKIRSNYVTPN